VLGSKRLRVLPAVAWESAGESDLISLDQKLRATEASFHDARLSLDEWPRLEGLALLAFRALGLADYARFDVRVDRSGEPFFLDANTRPSLEESSPTIHSAARAGLDYPATLRAIIASALERPRPRPHAAPSEPSRWRGR
jgi:D-alanine-D-alanine ligase